MHRLIASRYVCLSACLALGCGHSPHEEPSEDGPSSSTVDVGQTGRPELTQLDAGPGDSGQSLGQNPDALQDAAADPDAGDAGTGADAAAVRTSFATAQRIEPNGSSVLTDELSADQVDYYVFKGKAGTFYEISTDNGDYSPDNLLTLFDANQKLVASNDDGSIWPGDHFDTRLVVRLTTDADYYVRIDDPYTPAEFFDQSFRLLYYHLRVREVSASTPGFAAAAASPPAFQVDDQYGYKYVTIVDQLGPGSAPITFPALDNTALIAQIHPGGTGGSGSTFSDGRVSVTTGSGQRLALIDRSKNQVHFRPPISSGLNLVSLSTSSEFGTNPFYVIDLVLLPDNPKETNDNQNGRKEGAEALTLTRGRGLLLSHLPALDVDYYRLSAQAGQAIGFSCDGESTGSGVRGLRAELRDAQDNAVAVMADENGDLVTYAVETDGTYYLRLSSTTPPATADSVDPWARCVVRRQ